MSQLPKSRIRIAGDLFRFERLVDLLRPFQTNAFEEEIPLVPRFHGADSLQVEVAVFNDGTLLTDLSAIAQLELTIKPLQPDSHSTPDFDDPNPDAQRGPASNVAPIVCKRVSSEHFNTTLTESQWESKAASMAHAVITLDSEEAALAPGERWLSLVALGHDDQARTLAAGPVLILGGGATFNALPQPVVKDLRDQAIQAAEDAEAARDASQSARDTSLGYRNEAQTAHNQAVAAKEDATSAKEDALAAKDTAQSAQAAAQTARDEAVSAMGTAASAATAAANSVGTAQAAASGANLSAQAAAQSATDATAEANRAESEADRATTQANRSETQADRAQNIANNLTAVAEALSYRGEWVDSAEPVDAQRGWFWVITTAHTWGGITWAVGDAALYNGSIWARVSLDSLLAQANANIAALRQQLNATKQPLGGVWLDGMGGRIFIPPVPFVVGQTTVVCWYGSILHPDNSDRVIIQSGGASGYNVMRRGSNWLVAITNTASGNWATVNLPNPPASGDEGFWELEFDLTAGLAVTLRKDGESISTASTASTTGAIGNDFEHGILYGNTSGSTARSVGGLVRSLSVLNRALSSDERQQLLSSGGQIMPLTVRAHCVFDLLMDEGAGRQLRDRSGNTSDGQGLLSATGYTHLIPKDKATIRATAVDASSAMYLLTASDILPANAVVTGLIVDGTPIALSATAQPNARRRIRLAPSGGNLSVERSDGTNHTALATPIPVADLANLSLCIHYQII